MICKQFKLSQPEKEKLIRIKSRTGIHNWNILCRWALCYSLSEKTIPTDVPLVADSNLEMSWFTFGGEYSDIFDVLMKAWCIQMGLPTDDETMDIVQMVLCGKVNKNLVSLLRKAGGKGIGIAGMDGNLFEAVRKDDDHGNVGEIVDVHPEIVLDVLEKGYIPVVSSIAAGQDQTMNYNINADTAAEKLAIALSAHKFILLTDVMGLMEDPNNDDTLIPSLTVSQVPLLMKSGVISGGMIPKVECCVEAIRQGVHTVNIQDGRVPHSILIEILSEDGVGTMFY